MKDDKRDSRKTFSENARTMERESYGGRVSPTGYTDAMLGMDDIDKLRRIKLNRKLVNYKD